MNEELKKDNRAKPILDVLDTYPQRHRTGDRYVRNLFNCALLFYWDKFGNKEIGRVTEKIFGWAYTVRLQQHSIQLTSMSKYALAYLCVLRIIHDAMLSKEVLIISMKHLNHIQSMELGHILGIVMIDLNYYQPTN